MILTVPEIGLVATPKPIFAMISLPIKDTKNIHELRIVEAYEAYNIKQRNSFYLFSLVKKMIFSKNQKNDFFSKLKNAKTLYIVSKVHPFQTLSMFFHGAFRLSQ